MSLVKSKGNMYDWVTHMHTHIGGECPHKCSYCYVQTGLAKISGKYKGQLNLKREELNINYGAGKIIFIEHMNDLFAEGVPEFWIADILGHCRKYPENKYVFQTKNPKRVLNFEGRFPTKHLIGTTIETNRAIATNAPQPKERISAISDLSMAGCKVFITIEPIMDFDVDILSDWIISAKPEFVNIGADSKKCGLSEPTANKIIQFIDILNKNGIVIRQKKNLNRLTHSQPKG